MRLLLVPFFNMLSLIGITIIGRQMFLKFEIYTINVVRILIQLIFTQFVFVSLVCGALKLCKVSRQFSFCLDWKNLDYIFTISSFFCGNILLCCYAMLHISSATIFIIKIALSSVIYIIENLDKKYKICGITFTTIIIAEVSFYVLIEDRSYGKTGFVFILLSSICQVMQYYVTVLYKNFEKSAKPIDLTFSNCFFSLPVICFTTFYTGLTQPLSILFQTQEMAIYTLCCCLLSFSINFTLNINLFCNGIMISVLTSGFKNLCMTVIYFLFFFDVKLGKAEYIALLIFIIGLVGLLRIQYKQSENAMKEALVEYWYNFKKE